VAHHNTGMLWHVKSQPGIVLVKLDRLSRLRILAEPLDRTLWHRWMPLLPVRDIHGIWRMPDEVWRRWREARWEYSYRDPSEQELLDRQW